MRKVLLSISLCTLAWMAAAQNPFKCKLINKEEKINLVIDLYEESIPVPGMDMFGPLHGYMNGNVYGIWMITSAKIINEKEASIRLSNDFGSETQEIKLTVENDSTYNAELVDGVVIKKVIKKKLVKIPQKITFTKND